MILEFFSLFWLFPVPSSPSSPQRPPIRVSLPRRGSCGAPVSPPLPTSRAGLCQRLNKRLRPLDARPVTSPIHKTGTGCQAGAARAVAMETANPARALPHCAALGQSPADLWREAGNALLTGAVAGQGSPYLPGSTPGNRPTRLPPQTTGTFLHLLLRTPSFRLPPGESCDPNSAAG